MKFSVSFSESSLYDIENAFLWYEKQQSGLGLLFEEQLENALHLLTSDPFIFQIRYKNIRVLFLRKFPYGIHYRIKEDEIQVIGVFHCAQNPKSWKVRLKSTKK